MTETQPFFLNVEDDEYSREVLSVLLSKVMGFQQVEFFGNSENFSDRLQALPQVPDVIFLDIHIRPTDGYQLLDLLRNDPQYKNSKIIALTASVMVQDVKRLQDAGFDGLIGKPIANKVFPRLVNSILAGEPVWYIP
jgi:two-component system, cell cycle response regulator DivK